MKYFKKLNKRVKVVFCLRVLMVLISITLLVVVITARGQIGLIVAGGSFIASIAILSLLVIYEIWAIFRFIRKIKDFYKKQESNEEAFKDPKVLQDVRLLREIVENLDLETMDTIRSIKNKEDVTVIRAQFVLEQTEGVLKSVMQFISVYPSLKPNGIKDTKMLIMIYNRRIEALEEIINNG